MSTAQRALLVALAVLVGLAWWGAAWDVRDAEAHAVLVRSQPAAESRLDASPPAIDLWFSEPLEARFSTFEVLDAAGKLRTVDGIAVDTQDAHHLSGLPRRLPGGVYTVAYRTVSQDDGHEWTGTFAFTVLNPDGSVPSGQAFATDVERGSESALIAGRWLLFLGLSVLVGGALLVLLDGCARRGEADVIADDAALLQLRLAIAALPAIVGGLVLTLVNQVLALDASAGEVLIGSRFGVSWLARSSVLLLVIAIIAATLSMGVRHVLARRAAMVGLPVLGMTGMATMVAQSHAAAAPGWAWAIAFDLVHFAAAGAWIGGLIGVAALFVRGVGRGTAHQEALLRRWVLPFSTLAALLVFVLVLTGVLRSLGELPTASAVVSTAYGRALLVKLALIAPVLLIAWVNRRATQRLGNVQASAARFRRTLALEAGIGVLVLLSVAWLGQLPTARGFEQPKGPGAGTITDFNGIADSSDLQVHLQVSPATLGANQLRVHVYHPDGSSTGEISRVRLTIATGALSGGQQIDAAPQGNGVFLANEGFFSLALQWNVRVEVERPGHDDVAIAFDVPIAEGARGASKAGPFSNPAPQLTLNALLALVLAMIGAAVMVGWSRRGGSTSRATGAVLVGVGVMLWVSVERHPPDAAGFPANPVPSDAASQARGQALFAQYCVECHGPTGEGNGPLAATLNPPPASMAVHIPLHPDGQAYIFISKGFPGTAMPAWESRLSEQQRWDLVNYLRALTSTQVR
ncbi:MAG: copper resistance protein CopC [Dehalococcoidia bacterium]